MSYKRTRFRVTLRIIDRGGYCHINVTGFVILLEYLIGAATVIYKRKRFCVTLRIFDRGGYSQISATGFVLLLEYLIGTAIVK